MPTTYLILDIESVPDYSLWTPPPPKKPKKGEEDDDKKEPFAPHWAQIPVVIGCVWLDADLKSKKVGAMKIEGGLTGERQLLWNWNEFMIKEKPVIVTWYGRGFDMPVLSLRCLRAGIPMPWYYENNYRYRYSEDYHVDLCDVMADYGAIRGNMKMDSVAKLIGLPGKHEDEHGESMDGSKVKDMFEAGRIDDIANYCLSDCLQTAFIFQRWRYLKGRASIDTYSAGVLSLLEATEAQPPLSTFRKLVDDKTLLIR